MQVFLNPRSVESYRTFLKIKKLPAWKIRGRLAEFPDEYAGRLGLAPVHAKTTYHPEPFLFDYQKAITKIAVEKQKYAVFADCLAGETIVHSPDGDIAIADACARGTAMRVYALHHGKPVIAEASAPWVNGYADLYRFTLASGRTITATLAHRFLTCDGWSRGADLAIGERLLISDAGHLQSTAGTYLSRLPSDGHRLTRTTPNCLDDYSPCLHQCGARLRFVSDSDQALVPSSTDARVHIQQRSRTDGLASKSKHIHRCQIGDRLSIDHCDCQALSTAAAWEYSLPSFDQACIGESSHTSQQVLAGTSLLQQALESHPSVEQQNAGDPFQAFQPCDSTPLVEWDTLVAVDYIRTDVYYDMHVPVYHNFLANGVWSHNCGLGKSLILLSYARHVRGILPANKRILILTPPMVVPQLMAEARRFWGEHFRITNVKAANLQAWLESGDANAVIGVSNYEALKRDTRAGNLGALILDESGVLKSHYGNYASICLRLGRGLEWKLCCTGVPAPNDRIEYANHAVFLDRFPTVNSFLAKYFVNRGQTGERWELKPHALKPFYRSLSDWCIFLSDPRVYGWKDNCDTIPPIHVTIHEVPMTEDQKQWVQRELGTLVAVRAGGITKRAAYGQVAKGFWKGKEFATNKPQFIRELVDGWRKEESTLIWCLYDKEQDSVTAAVGGESMYGKTPMKSRLEMLERFKTRESDTMISKPRVLGFGLNLQVATRQVFSGLQDSFESYYQAVKRSNRIGSTKPLSVHIPVVEIEEPMVENVLRKAKRVESDTREQEELFREQFA